MRLAVPAPLRTNQPLRLPSYMSFAVDSIVDLSFTHRAPLETLHETGGDHGTGSQGGLLVSTRQGPVSSQAARVASVQAMKSKRAEFAAADRLSVLR